MSKRIGFVSLKGGVGKTSLAVHMAHFLHEEGERVALIDGENTRTALEESGLTTYRTILHTYKAYEFARLAGTSVRDAGHAGSARAWGEFLAFAGEVLSGL